MGIGDQSWSQIGRGGAIFSERIRSVRSSGLVGATGKVLNRPRGTHFLELFGGGHSIGPVKGQLFGGAWCRTVVSRDTPPR